MIVQSLSRMLPGIHRSVESGVHPMVSLTRGSSFLQMKDDTTAPEAITIREIFKAPCLQSLRNLESLVSEKCKKKGSGSQQALEETIFLEKSSSSFQASPRASELMQKLSHGQKSAAFWQQSYDHDMEKVTSEDEQVHYEVKCAELSLKDGKRQSDSPSQTEKLRSADPVPVTAQPKSPQLDPLENLIEQLQKELVFLRLQVSFLQIYSCNPSYFLTRVLKTVLIIFLLIYTLKLIFNNRAVLKKTKKLQYICFELVDLPNIFNVSLECNYSTGFIDPRRAE